MKKIFFILFLWTGIVQASTINNVWFAWMGGVNEPQCRALWNEYDIRHGTKTIFHLKTGADGLIALNDMLTSSATRRFFCGGSSQLVNNPLTGNDGILGQIEPLIQTTVNSVIWYVPNQNKSQNFKELVSYFKELNRPVNVGIFFSSQKSLVSHLERVYGISFNVIMYRTPPQMYPDLASGSLDLAFDSGTAIDLVKETGKFQIVGYSSNTNYKRLEKYPNFKNNDAELMLYPSWQVIIVPSNLDAELKKSVGQQLQNIVQSDLFKKICVDYLCTVTAIVQPEINSLVIRQRKIMENQSK
jgi:tripartite-type tricarboxylate transporter receptor subunit TctC